MKIAYPGFCSVKQLGVFPFPTGWNHSPSQGYHTPSSKFAGTHLYTWIERCTVRVKCFTQKRNKMSSARAQPQTTWSRVKSTNHKATVSTSIKWVTLKTHVTTAVYRFKWDSYHYNYHLHVSTLQCKSSFPKKLPVCMGNWQIDNTVRHKQSSVLSINTT